MAVQSEPLRIFCAFAPEDKALYHRLHSHLRPLEQKGMLTVWHQRLITAGTDWKKAIDEQLANASIVLLLISPAFFASDYCLGAEMYQVMQQQKIGTARIIPILLRPVEWTLAPFAHLSCLLSNRKPLTEWSNRDAAFADIVAGLLRVIEELTSGLVWDAYGQIPDGVWNVPYRRNPYFTGRSELLKKLGQQLSPGTGDEQLPLAELRLPNLWR